MPDDEDDGAFVPMAESGESDAEPASSDDDDGDKRAAVAREWSQHQFGTTFARFGVTAAQVNSEAGRDRYQRRQARVVHNAANRLGEAERNALNANGGVAGTINFAKIPLAGMEAAVGSYAAHKDLRTAARRSARRALRGRVRSSRSCTGGRS